MGPQKGFFFLIQALFSSFTLMAAALQRHTPLSHQLTQGSQKEDVTENTFPDSALFLDGDPPGRPYSQDTFSVTEKQGILPFTLRANY